MAIIDTKERALRPLSSTVLFRFGFHDVENDGDAILIVISHDSLVSISAICSDDSIPLRAVLGRLIVWH